MNFKKYFIANQRVNFSQIGLLVLSILLLPTLMSLFLGYTAGNKLNPTVKSLDIKTKIVIEKKGFSKGKFRCFF